MSRITTLEEHHKTYSTERWDFPIGPITYLNRYVNQKGSFSTSELTLTSKSHVGAVFSDLPNAMEVVCLD